MPVKASPVAGAEEVASTAVSPGLAPGELPVAETSAGEPGVIDESRTPLDG
jgi:hypothetical protein